MFREPLADGDPRAEGPKPGLACSLYLAVGYSEAPDRSLRDGELATYMTKTYLTIIALAAVCLSCEAREPPEVAPEEAWREPAAMSELFAARQDDRYGLWIDLINRMSKDRKVTIAEIGVWEGEFAEQILKNCPNVEKYYLVDPWRHLGDWNKPLNLNNERMELAFQTTMKRVDFAKDRVAVLRGTTLEISDQIEDGELDLVYIDGDHTAKGIVIDLIRLHPKVADDGVIGGDDYVDNIYHHDPDRFDPTMIKPVVNGFVAAHRVDQIFSNSSQFAFFK